MSDENIKVDGSKCSNVTINPSTEEGIPTVEIKADDFLNQFSDEVLTEDPDVAEAKKKISSIISYLKSNAFKKDVERKAYKAGIPPRQVAKGAIAKAFGIVGDILGIAIDTANCTANGLIDLLSDILHKGVELITKIASGLCRIFTFNQTATATN